jgi:hypothetical protein
MAIMSVIIAIISISFNRFNEQFKIAQDISAELNQFRLVRSTLWKDFTTADSIAFNDDQIKIYKDNKLIQYQETDESLHRNHTGDWQDLNVEVESVFVDSLLGLKKYHINFLWKGEEMDWSFLDKPSLAVQINTYFKEIK